MCKFLYIIYDKSLDVTFEMKIPLVKLDTTKDHIKKNDISIIKAFNFHKNECP